MALQLHRALSSMLTNLFRIIARLVLWNMVSVDLLLEFRVLQCNRLTGPNWRNLRRAAHDVLSPEACAKYIPIQRAEACKLLHDFLEQPKVGVDHPFSER